MVINFNLGFPGRRGLPGLPGGTFWSPYFAMSCPMSRTLLQSHITRGFVTKSFDVDLCYPLKFVISNPNHKTKIHRSTQLNAHSRTNVECLVQSMTPKHVKKKHRIKKYSKHQTWPCSFRLFVKPNQNHAFISFSRTRLITIIAAFAGFPCF